MATDRLTTRAIKDAAPAARPYRLADGKGLVLEVTAEGHKRWRFRYRFGNREKMLSLGVFPDVPLSEARERRRKARLLLDNNVDPSAARKAARAAQADPEEPTFEAVAREWYALHADSWNAKHAERVLGRLQKYIFPVVGAQPVADIRAPELLRAVRRVEARGVLETAHRALRSCSQVFRYAIATGRADRDPAADLRGALKPARGGHFAAITDPAQLGALLRAIDGYSGTPLTRIALQLAPLVFARPGELRGAEWAEVDLDEALWTIPAARMKSSRDHLVPLADQAVALFREAEAFSGGGRFVFPSLRGAKRPISDMTLSAALRRLGYTGEQVTLHGFRATARTLLDEVLHFRPDYIEHQLAHAVRDPLGRAYNRTQFLPERRAMMQRWADYLDALRDPSGKVVPLRPAAER